MNNLSLTHITREPRSPVQFGSPPLLILLHGVGSNERDLMGLASELDPRFFVVSARAPIRMGPDSFGWYHVEFTPAGYNIDESEAARARDMMLKFVSELKAAYNVDPDRVFLVGFSQGCIVSLAAALAEPRSFAGVAGMSGRLLDTLMTNVAPAADLEGLPVLVVHGTRDTVIPVAHGRAIRDQLSGLPVAMTYREYEMAHHVTRESIGDIARWLTARLDSPHDWRTPGA